MICYSCIHKVVCKHFQQLTEHGIEASKCINHKDGSSINIMGQGALASRQTGNNFNYKSVSENFSSVYKKNLNTKKAVPEKIKIECPSCNGIDYEDEIRICSECSTPVCGNCSTVSSDGVLLCDKCYTKTDSKK